MVYDRARDQLEHTIFRDLVHFLKPDDLLVLNRTKVIPARLYGRKIPTGGKVELLLLREVNEDYWEVMVGGKGIRPGSRLQLEDGPEALVVEDLGRSLRLLKFLEPVWDVIVRSGRVPLPPYIHESLSESARYQTVYAQDSGSAAAPTAGLHFTPELLDNIRTKGVNIAEVTLHIGLDTFAPIHEEDPREHHIHSEWCSLSLQAAEQINRTRAGKGRVIAVGTTTVRTLETAALQSPDSDQIAPFQGQTDLYILPGFDFQVVDGLVTNFHLPESTLLMLVSAFTGRKKILQLYKEGMQENYRFYSFGDAMLLL
jgi:S-adenosylmethionine:tRNA ribosyltransferase-isomerase